MLLLLLLPFFAINYLSLLPLSLLIIVIMITHYYDHPPLLWSSHDLQYDMEKEVDEDTWVVGGEGGGGGWVQGLYSIEFRVFDQRQSPSHHSNNRSSGKGNSNSNSHSNSNSTKKRSKILEKKLKTLERVLIDSDGGLTNEISMPTSGGTEAIQQYLLSNPPFLNTIFDANTPFLIHRTNTLIHPLWHIYPTCYTVLCRYHTHNKQTHHQWQAGRRCIGVLGPVCHLQTECRDIRHSQGTLTPL